MIRFAVIADPHVHDCSWLPSASGLPGAIRSFEETAQSTRVFNESVPAFRAALTAAVDAGVELVLLVGDLTDDGQKPNISAALDIIAEYRTRYGLRVLMTPGNHDFFAIAGRPQCKTFLDANGAGVPVDSRTCPEAATLGAPQALDALSGLGFKPEETELHWETPFGDEADWRARSYRVDSPQGHVSCEMIDASYLVEPIEGLWVLSIDANVCIPRDDARDLDDAQSFLDPSKSGWNVVLKHRPHLLPWIGDVVARARRLGKRLVAFSHYPLVDVLGNSAGLERSVFGDGGLAQRIPVAEVAERVAATGLPLHFSGHLHVNDTARHRSAAGSFVNIAVPSPVGYGAGLKIVELAGGETHIRTLSLRHFSGFDLAFSAYRAEATHSKQLAPDASFALDHGEFLSRHLTHLVRHRYLPREWPADMAGFVQAGTVSDLLALLALDISIEEDWPLITVVEDWYRFRKAGVLALPDIEGERVAFYQALTAAPRHGARPGLASSMSCFIELLALYMSRLPSGDFTIGPDLDITAHTRGTSFKAAA